MVDWTDEKIRERKILSEEKLNILSRNGDAG